MVTSVNKGGNGDNPRGGERGGGRPNSCTGRYSSLEATLYLIYCNKHLLQEKKINGHDETNRGGIVSRQRKFVV